MSDASDSVPLQRFERERKARLEAERIAEEGLRRLYEQQSELRRQEESFRQLYENSPIGIYRTAASGEVLMANRALLDMLGFDSADALRERNLNREGFTEGATRSRFLLDVSEEDEIRGHESKWLHRDGSTVYVRESARAVRDEDGHLLHFEGWVEDVTTQHEAEEAIRQAQQMRVERDAADAANRAKTTFLAQMSHELRTPLNSVIAMSDMLMKGYLGDLQDEQLEYLGDIKESGEHLLGLINSILDLTKIEAGHSPLEVSRVDVGALLGDSMKVIRERARSGEIECRVDVAADLPSIVADERKLRQVVYNLLSNAVKFTPTGGRITVSGAGTERGVRIEVTDTGIGIDPADHDSIFREFVQADDALSRNYEGTGLGLSLVKQFVEQHGGTVSLRSAPGAGSTFTVELPLQPSEESLTRETAKESA